MKQLLLAGLLAVTGACYAQVEMIAKKVQIGQAEKEFQLTKRGHYFVLNGDIIMGDDLPRTKSYIRTDATGRLANIWPQGYVPVKISEEVVKYDMFKPVLQALNTLNNTTNVRIKPYSGEADYITIDMYMDDPNLGGMSAVGKQGGEQILWLNRNQGEFVVLHELLHALGLWHEQSRSDRDNYVKIDMAQVKDGYKHNFQIEPGMAAGSYDYRSIMHYPANAFGITGAAVTIQCKNNGAVAACQLGNDKLSAKDIAGLNALFIGNQSLSRIDLAKAFNIGIPNHVTGALEDGVYRIKIQSTAKFLDVKDVNTANGAVLQQWDAAGGANQQFAVTNVGNGLYELKAMHSGRYLSVHGASTKDLEVIEQWDHVNQTNQRFEIIYVKGANGYYVRGQQSAKFWGLLGLNNGGLIIQQTKPVQSFAFERIGPIPLDVKPAAGEKIRSVVPAKDTRIYKMKKQK